MRDFERRTESRFNDLSRFNDYDWNGLRDLECGTESWLNDLSWFNDYDWSGLKGGRRVVFVSRMLGRWWVVEWKAGGIWILKLSESDSLGEDEM